MFIHKTHQRLPKTTIHKNQFKPCLQFGFGTQMGTSEAMYSVMELMDDSLSGSRHRYEDRIQLDAVEQHPQGAGGK